MMKFIISPSKSMLDKVDIDIPYTDLKYSTPQYLKEANKIMAILKKLSVEDITKKFKVSNKIAEKTFDMISNFDFTANEKKCIPAIYAYVGDFFQNLDPFSLKKEALFHINSSCRILSGVYGVLKPLDLIQPYRLEMLTKLEVEGCKNLYEFWTTKITQSLKIFSEGNLFNLASQEYSKTCKINTKEIKVLENKKGVYKTIGTNAKKIRGLIAREIAQKKISSEFELTKKIGDYKLLLSEKIPELQKLKTDKTIIFFR